MRQAFEGPEIGASLPEIKPDVERQHVSCILKIRLDQASRYEDNSAFPERYSRERQLFEQRQGGHQGMDGRRSSLCLEHRVHEGMSCKVNCKGRLRLNTRGPP